MALLLHRNDVLRFPSLEFLSPSGAEFDNRRHEPPHRDNLSRAILCDWRLIATSQTEIRSQTELGDKEQFLVGSQAGSVTLVCCRVRKWVEQELLT